MGRVRGCTCSVMLTCTPDARANVPCLADNGFPIVSTGTLVRQKGAGDFPPYLCAQIHFGLSLSIGGFALSKIAGWNDSTPKIII